jgi:hypothetical protein
MQVSFAAEGTPADVKDQVQRQASKQTKDASPAVSSVASSLVSHINTYVDALPADLEDVTVSVTFGIYHKEAAKAGSGT